MPKADKGVTGKSPGKQEVDVKTRAVTSLAEAMDRLRLADEKAWGTCLTPPDVEHHRGERFAIYVEVERHRVSALYEHLKRATSLAHATADKEAKWFKRIYDR